MNTLKNGLHFISSSATPKCNPHPEKGCRLHLGCTSKPTKCNPTFLHHLNTSTFKCCTLHFNAHTSHHEQLPYFMQKTLEMLYSVVIKNEVQPATLRTKRTRP